MKPLVAAAVILVSLAIGAAVQAQTPAIDALRAHAEQGTLTRSSPYQARKSGDDASLPVIRDRILTEVDVEQRPA